MQIGQAGRSWSRTPARARTPTGPSAYLGSGPALVAAVRAGSITATAGR